MKQKVLIVSYYWPNAGGPGVQRWLKFTKYLPDNGYLPVVYVPENPAYPILDDSLEQQVGEHVIVLKNKIREPYGMLQRFLGKNKSNALSSGMIPNARKQTKLDKILLWIRGNVFIPDPRASWVNPSVRFLKAYLKQHPEITKVITTGPPHSMHLIGLKLKKQLPNIKWVADFRDPWTTITYHKELKLTKYAQNKHLKLERSVLQQADHIVVTSKGTKREFEQITPVPISIITNGYDVVNVGKVALSEKFTLAHIGSFLANRNPRILWKAIAELRKENQEFKADFRLTLAGKISNDILETIEEFGLLECCDNLGYIDTTQALIQMRKAQVLLLVEIDSLDTQCIIPGKLFEYMAAERPILAIGPEDADFYDIVTQTNSGKCALYCEKEKVREILLEYYALYRQQNLKVAAMGLQYYSRSRLTSRLAGVLDKL